MVLLGLFLACPRAPSPEDASPDAGRLAATFRGGAVTLADAEAEANHLTPALREQFANPAGREALVLSLVDKALLVREARRRKLDRDPELERQVRDLEDRLLIKALVADEQEHQGPPPDQALRSFYQANAERYALPERVRVARVLVRTRAPTPAGVTAARVRAERLRARLVKGEALASVEKDADGPERAQGGEWGTFAQADFRDPAVGRAAFALDHKGAVSKVLTTADGMVVLRLIARMAARVPPFEEVRTRVGAEVAARRQRAAFDALRKRLRADADVHLEPSRAR